MDPGLVRAVKKQFGSVTAEERGSLLEGFVLTLLRAHAEEQELYEDIYYWAPTQASRVEVDFLLQRGGRFIAIEVKSQARYSTSMLSGLKAIGELPRVVRRILLYGGARSLKTSDAIDVWPFKRFFETLEAGKIWP